MSEISIVNLTKKKVPLKDLKLVALETMKQLSLSGELSLVLAGDARLRTLNRQYRGKDKVTDILTFKAPKINPELLGEIFINLADCDRVKRYGDVFSTPPSRDYLLFFLLIHGLLHLAGYNDEKEKERLEMVDLGQELMIKLIKAKKISLKS